MSNKTWPCPFNLQPFSRKTEAEAASPVRAAEKCGRCKQWHPVYSRKKGRRK